ncbi:MAG: divalent-cation tolerance protein CutA [Candidatus Sericytochromatia bacterium]|nr:divalent-cation tolerance protein CutA [Candidatus Sericytochromatia bacterium]
MKVLLTTCPGSVADDLARGALERRLAACCSRLPVTSTYWWQGELISDEECLLLFKSADDRLDALLTHLQEAHPYEVPELLVVEPTHVSAAYANWVLKETRTPLA